MICKTKKSGVLCQKQVSRAATTNYKLLLLRALGTRFWHDIAHSPVTPIPKLRLLYWTHERHPYLPLNGELCVYFVRYLKKVSTRYQGSHCFERNQMRQSWSLQNRIINHFYNQWGHFGNYVLTLPVPRPKYTGRARSILWLLMSQYIVSQVINNPINAFIRCIQSSNPTLSLFYISYIRILFMC